MIAIDGPGDPAPRPPATRQALVIASGAGGAAVLLRVLADLPRDLPGPIAIAQHLPPGATQAFANAIRASTLRRVVVVTGDAHPGEPGVVYLGDDGAHLVFAGQSTLAADRRAPRDGHRPSATLLFTSAANHHDRAAVGVVLRGRGNDGAAGLLAMRARGAATIAEAPQAAHAPEMPEASIALGAAARVLPWSLLAAAVRAALRAGEPAGAGWYAGEGPIRCGA